MPCLHPLMSIVARQESDDLYRANLFKNQADLYWRVIYDPLGFA